MTGGRGKGASGSLSISQAKVMEVMSFQKKEHQKIRFSITQKTDKTRNCKYTQILKYYFASNALLDQGRKGWKGIYRTP